MIVPASAIDKARAEVIAMPDNVVRGFTEEHVIRLTGLTRSQLRYWDRTGFFSPAFASGDGRGASNRIYSFRNVVGLKTLGILRNGHKVSLQHLREVAHNLSDRSDDLWTRTVLYVLGRRVVITDENTGRLLDAASGQYVNGLALKAVMSEVERQADTLNTRPDDSIGKITRHRNIVHNQWVIGGTRIPVESIKRFHSAGYTVVQIIEEYPDLTEADITAAIAHEGNAAA